jgi:hypothetical protein
MFFRMVITNHGKHSDAKLATVTAADLVENAANLSGQDAIDMRRLENQIADILEPHFKALSDRENGGLEKGHEHLALSYEAHPETAAAMEAEIMAAYKASPFAAKMDDAVAAANVHEVVHKWVCDAQHMHRDHFVSSGGQVGNGADLRKVPDFDPNNEHVRRWKSLYTPSTPDEHRKALHELMTGERMP